MGPGTASRRLLPAAAVLTLALAVAAAGGSAPQRTGPRTAPAGHTTAVRAAAADDCTPGNMTRSVTPSADQSGSKVRKIVQRGHLIAGVDQNSYRWGYRDPVSGRFEGFDIDLVHAIAEAILGDPDKVQFKSVPTAKRIEAVQSGQVDLIVRTMTISCARLRDVAFSTAYFQAGQQVVVPATSQASTVDQALRGRTVCAAEGSTAQEELKRDPRGATVHLVGNQLDCLVLMQLGRVDATMTDDALAAGQLAQDPTLRLVGDPLTVEPYGVAMNRGDTDLVARVNQVLTDYRNGPWQRSYRTWLQPYLGRSAEPPAARYLP